MKRVNLHHREQVELDPVEELRAVRMQVAVCLRLFRCISKGDLVPVKLAGEVDRWF